MKRVLTVVFFLPLFSISQECKLNKSTDNFTHEVRLSTGFMPLNIGFDRVLLSIDANNAEVDFFFSVSGDSKCFDNSSTATILFDGSKSKNNFKNTGTMNCEGLFHFTFRNLAGTPGALQRFATQKVSSISFAGNNKKITLVTLNEAQKVLLINMAACLIKESKTLLKK
jgi:hypothetical protein